MPTSQTRKLLDQYLANKKYVSKEEEHVIKKNKELILARALDNLDLHPSFITKLSQADCDRLIAELDRIIYFAADLTPVFKNNEIATPSQDATTAKQAKKHMQNYLKFLLVGAPFQFSEFKQQANVYALARKQNVSLLDISRNELQRILDTIDIDALNHLSEAGKRRFHLQLADLLCFFTFVEPEGIKTVRFPQLSHGQWQRVTFDIHAIKLKPNKTMFPDVYNLFKDENGDNRDQLYQLYAYGLTPKDDVDDVPPHLLFMGTPPQTNFQGFYPAVHNDFIPHHSVGEVMYKSNRDRLRTWIQDVTKQGQNKLRVAGQSLGGALLEMLVLDMPAFVESAIAVNPPGLLKETYKDDLFQTWHHTEPEQRPRVTIQLQAYDPVQYVGYFDIKEWEIVRLYPDSLNLGLATPLAPFFAHLKSFANQPGTIALVVNNDVINKERLRACVTLGKSAILDPIAKGCIEFAIRQRNPV